MKQIRKGCFETNSSSMHAIVMDGDFNFEEYKTLKAYKRVFNNKKISVNIPKEIEITPVFFGWGLSLLNNEFDCLNYLYASIISYYDAKDALECIKNISTMLKQIDIELVVPETIIDKELNKLIVTNDGKISRTESFFSCGVDHNSNSSVDSIIKCEHTFYSFVFSGGVIVSNDNGGWTFFENNISRAQRFYKNTKILER